TFTLQGDFYTNRDLRREQAHAETSGANLLGRWRRTFATDANVEAEVYWDRTYRLIPGGFEETRNTAVASGKYRFGHGRHDLLIGADGQFSWDEIGEKG